MKITVFQNVKLQKLSMFQRNLLPLPLGSLYQALILYSHNCQSIRIRSFMLHMKPTHQNARGSVMSVQSICSCYVYFYMVNNLYTVANRRAVINSSASFLICLLKSDNLKYTKRFQTEDSITDSKIIPKMCAEDEQNLCQM